MSLDSIALLGEVLSWIGLGIGVPVLILARIVRASESRWREIDIVVVDEDGTPLARWFTAGELHQRPLRRSEAGRIGKGWHPGQVDTGDTDRIRFGSRLIVGPTLWTLSIIFVATGLIGFAASWLPVLF
ncbi:MAG: hypothetical protein R2719_04405 [Micropruina sp.]